MATNLERQLQTILNEKQTKVLPNNIRKGVKIFDVEGTADIGAVEIKNQDKVFTENGIYTADDGYTGLGSIVVNVSKDGGKGDVKLFNTVEEMQADTTAQEGDLAIVYTTGHKIMDINDTTKRYNTFAFPKTVVLNEAYTGSTTIYGRMQSVDAPTNYMITSTLSASNVFTFVYKNSSTDTNKSVRYTSSDGITYTVDTSYTNNAHDGSELFIVELPYNFRIINTTSISFPEIMLHFIRIPQKRFDGLYEYKNGEYVIAENQYTLFEQSQLLKDVIAYGKDGNIVGAYNFEDTLSPEQYEQAMNLTIDILGGEE